MSQTVSMQEMCETIERAAILKRSDGTRPTAREIYEYSPRGELFMVFEWYSIARALEGKP